MAARQSVKLKDHTILALDIGSRFIKVAESRLAKGHDLLTQCRSAAHSPRRIG